MSAIDAKNFFRIKGISGGAAQFERHVNCNFVLTVLTTSQNASSMFWTFSIDKSLF